MTVDELYRASLKKVIESGEVDTLARYMECTGKNRRAKTIRTIAEDISKCDIDKAPIISLINKVTDPTLLHEILFVMIGECK